MTEKSIVQVSMNGQGVLHRRGFLRSIGIGAAGASALSFTDLMAVHADELRKQNMACIVLWMQGGPSQFETFDPKPNHENGGETEVLKTKVPGIEIAEGWEKVSGALKDIALIRSMTNREGNHQRATYQLHTGYAPSGSVKHPSFGSAVAQEIGPKDFDLPHIVRIGARGVTSGAGAGFLGTTYEPFQVPNPEQPPTNVTLPVNRSRFTRRMGLLEGLEKVGFGATGGADRVREHQALYRQTAGMILSPRMKAFDLEPESPAMRDFYGRNAFGQGCLLARRLVEAGVTFIEVERGGWDTHNNQKDRLGNIIPAVDQGFAALVHDLRIRGLLDSTLVVWMGEFGRTPRINPNAGRDHFPRAFNVALSGAGVQGGQVIGATTSDGTAVDSDPVSVNDLLTTMCQALKIDPRTENMSPLGRPIKIVEDGKVVPNLLKI